jgi:hypothetical protein
LAGFFSPFGDSLAWAGTGIGNVDATRTVSMAYSEAQSPTVPINNHRTQEDNTIASGKLFY